MRIAIVTAWYPSNTNPLYGIFIQNQARALSKHCDVTVLLLSWSLIPSVKEWNDDGVRVIEKRDFYFPNANENMLNFWATRYVRFFKNIHLQSGFELIHCHDHYGAFVGDRIKREIGLPYVCTIHNSNIMNDRLPDWKKTYLPRILKNSDKVIAVGSRLAEKLNTRYSVEEVTVIPNYVDTESFDFRPEFRDSGFNFIFVGGLEMHKGILDLVKAFELANIEEAFLHIVGKGPLHEKITDLIESRNLSNKIILHGEVANRDLPHLYNASKVCVSVSEYETFGVAVLEAMACGLPVLYTASGGPEEVVAPFAGIKIEHRSIQKICEGLIQIHQSFADFDSRAIRRYVVDEFGSDKVIGRLLEEYKMATDGRD